MKQKVLPSKNLISLMQKLIIKGKRELKGKFLFRAKNSTLPILAASILANKVSLKNIPLVKIFSQWLSCLIILV